MKAWKPLPGPRSVFPWVGAGLFVACCLTLAQQEPPAPQEGTPASQEEPASLRDRFRIDVNLITLRFTVRDGSGAFVNTLREEDFRVFENGAPRSISFFEPPRATGRPGGRLQLAFLLDVSGSTFSTRTEQILAARTFLDSITDLTEVGIFGFTDRLLVFQEFTSDRSAALQAFSTARKHLGQTAIYDSLNTLMDRMMARGSATDQRVIIVVSDSLDEAYVKASQSITLARQNNIVLYTVHVPSSSQLYIGPAHERLLELSIDPSIPQQEEKERAFARLSAATGGRHFSGLEAILDFDQALARINDDVFGNLYVVAFHTDSPTLDKEERNIRVVTGEPYLQVSALFREVPERLKAKKRFIAALFDNQSLSELPSGLHASFRELGAEMDILSPRWEGSRVGLSFRLKISPFSLQGSRAEGVQTQLGVIGVLMDAEGNEVVRLREFFRVSLGAREIRDGRGIIYTNKLLAPPGVYDFKLALLEVDTWRMTAFQNRVQIAER